MRWNCTKSLNTFKPKTEFFQQPKKCKWEWSEDCAIVGSSRSISTLMLPWPKKLWEKLFWASSQLELKYGLSLVMQGPQIKVCSIDLKSQQQRLHFQIRLTHLEKFLPSMMSHIYWNFCAITFLILGLMSMERAQLFAWLTFKAFWTTTPQN